MKLRNVKSRRSSGGDSDRNNKETGSWPFDKVSNNEMKCGKPSAIVSNPIIPIACRRSERVKARLSLDSADLLSQQVVTVNTVKKKSQSLTSPIEDSLKVSVNDVKNPCKTISDSDVVTVTCSPDLPSLKPFQLLKCTFCTKQFTQAWMLRLHTMSHNRRKSLDANVERKFSESEVTSLPYTKSYACAYCYIKFTDPNKLRSHQQTHSENDFQCNKCPESFQTKWGLQAHLMMSPHILGERNHFS